MEKSYKMNTKTVKLGYSNGCFKIFWQATMDEKEWVGIYKDNSADDSDYFKDHWQWAYKGSSYQTSLALCAGYQARYLVYDNIWKKYCSIARTDPFPAINVRVTGKIDFTLGYQGEYFIIDGKTESPRYRDWIGIFKADETDTRKYLFYQWADQTRPPYKTSIKVDAGFDARYYRFDEETRTNNLLAKTISFPDIVVSSETNIPGTRDISSGEFEELRSHFPALKKGDVRVTGEKSITYNGFAWALGFNDRWISPPEDLDEFTNQFCSYGYFVKNVA